MLSSFEDDLKWCSRCGKYRRYLLALYVSYCSRCGSLMVVFSREDMKRFKGAPVPKN